MHVNATGISYDAAAGVVSNISQCQITPNTRFARHVWIIKANPTTNPNPNPKILTLTT